MKLVEAIAFFLQGQGHAELRLSTGAFEKHHQLPGDFQGHVTTQIGFHHRQRQIDTGGHSG
ncbi:hypothetical protein D3C73_1671200 [compost metagenome]